MPIVQYVENGKRKTFKLPEDRMAIFGREEKTDFQMKMDALISREHFGIEKDEDGRVLLIDLGSKNGTYLNGGKMEDEAMELKDGDEIKAGSQVFIFYHSQPKETTQDFVDGVADSMDKGKGFHTVMSEILGNKK